MQRRTSSAPKKNLLKLWRAFFNVWGFRCRGFSWLGSLNGDWLKIDIATVSFPRLNKDINIDRMSF